MMRRKPRLCNGRGLELAALTLATAAKAERQPEIWEALRG